MANIVDYVKWRGDITFEEKGFNEVDGLIFSELAYLTLDGIVSESFAAPVSLRDIYPEYMNADKKRPVYQDAIPLLEVAAESNRFADIKLCGFLNHILPEMSMQFAAVCFLLPEFVYVAFRGTDETITGWREDFDAFYIEATHAQYHSVNYLAKVMDAFDMPVVTGGHSKGGNLAVFSSAFSEKKRQERIIDIYSYDGPGFNDVIIEKEEYKGIIPKVISIIPESSIVGILLSTKEDKKVIKSSAPNGFLQHNPFTWQVLGTGFEEADAQSSSSVFMDETLKEWLNSLDNEQKGVFITSFFDLLEASGATTMTEIGDNKLTSLMAIFKAGIGLPAEKQKIMVQAIKKFAAAARKSYISKDKSK